MKQINFATTNSYKIEFANRILNKLDWEVIPTDVTIIEPQSISQEFVAEYKVKQAYEQVNKPIVTMDSGLFINALSGFPGVYTSDIFKMLSKEDIIKILADKPDRSAYIQQTVAYFDGTTLEVFSSKAEGQIVQLDNIKEGKNYDGFFFEKNLNKLKADMTPEEQSKIWGDAWVQLASWLDKYLDK